MDNIFLKRRDKVRNALIRRGFDALLVSSPANRFYLSGFELHDPQPGESAGRLLISASGDDWLATDPRYELAAKALWPGERVWIYGGNQGAPISELLALNGGLIGLETVGVSVGFAKGLAGSGRRAFVPRFISADGIVEKEREIKGPEELAALRASFAINHKTLSWLETRLANGEIGKLTEKELAWEIERYFRENGASEQAFATIVAAGENAALPHAVPGDVKIGDKAELLVDLGCRADNYCSDQTRTWRVGRAPAPAFDKTMELVRKAQDESIAMMRPGVKCADVYKKALEIFEKEGQGKAFNHALGHGIGLLTHEAPSLSPRSETTLEEGMVVTVEPGLYYADWGGVRWENTVVVTRDGAEIL